MIRKILAPVRGDGRGENVLAHAALLARRYGAHIDVTHCRPRAEDMLPHGVPLPAFLKDQIAGHTDALNDAEEARLRAEFDRIMGDLHLPVDEAPTGAEPSARWIEEVGKQVEVIKRRGRLADLIVVPKPERDRNLGTNSLMTAIFHTGRPVLMAPPRETPPDALGARVAFAWNGSLEASRAAALCLDVLLSAQSVVVYTVEGKSVRGASLDDLKEYLAVRGLTPDFVSIPVEKSIGEALLRRSAADSADLLIMGAYSQSHEKEAVFGGVTQFAVDKSEMPIIFVH